MKQNDSKYPKDVIARIAQDIDSGVTCVLNTDTMKNVVILDDSYDIDMEDLNEDAYKVIDSWENTVQLEPVRSGESFSIMERFIESCIPENDKIKHQLQDAISKRRPFHNFRLIIDNSDYYDAWFEFKQAQIEQYILEQLP